jgi:V8-like Glu-specific endopeptidase
MLSRSASAVFAKAGAACAAVLLFSVGCSRTWASDLDPDTLAKVHAATFEVVAAKPTTDPLTYEKPLPLDLIPYQERNDKYFSVGTAFALGNNRYVTAAHVLLSGLDSIWGTPELRDADGKVFEIDKIEKYSEARDFAVFSLKHGPDVAPLAVDTSPTLNEVVYAVGNALGTGIVVRNGLYTSTTPEEQAGEWNWIRFSAAASPGNSGGPLLSKDGKLIGVVLRKSSNENLNYALPIAQLLDAPDHVAVIAAPMSYRLDLFDDAQIGKIKTSFPLPLSFAEFDTRFQKEINAFNESQLKTLLQKEPDRIFPHGAGSNRILHGIPSLETFPAIITRNDAGYWERSGKKGDKTQLDANGYIVSGGVGKTLLFRFRRPDDLSTNTLYSDPNQVIDRLAKLGYFVRHVGSDKVKVTALGKPTEDTTFVDSWHRVWQLRSWPLPYANSFVIALSLPVPDGYITMLRYAPASSLHDHELDLKTQADFVSVAYEGTLAQWADFLTEKPLLPAALRDVKIESDYGHRFSYASKRLQFSYVPDLQPIEANSVLTLGFGFFEDHGAVVWDVGDVGVKRSANEANRINIARHVAPSDDLDDSYKSSWDKISTRRHPYDAVVRLENDESRITGVVDTKVKEASKVLYSAFVAVTGNSSQDTMGAKLTSLLSDLHANEH